MQTQPQNFSVPNNQARELQAAFIDIDGNKFTPQSPVTWTVDAAYLELKVMADGALARITPFGPTGSTLVTAAAADGVSQSFIISITEAVVPEGAHAQTLQGFQPGASEMNLQAATATQSLNDSTNSAEGDDTIDGASDPAGTPGNPNHAPLPGEEGVDGAGRNSALGDVTQEGAGGQDTSTTAAQSTQGRGGNLAFSGDVEVVSGNGADADSLPAGDSDTLKSAAVPEHWTADGEPKPGNPLLGTGSADEAERDLVQDTGDDSDTTVAAIDEANLEIDRQQANSQTSSSGDGN